MSLGSPKLLSKVVTDWCLLVAVCKVACNSLYLSVFNLTFHCSQANNAFKIIYWNMLSVYQWIQICKNEVKNRSHGNIIRQIDPIFDFLRICLSRLSLKDSQVLGKVFLFVNRHKKISECTNDEFPVKWTLVSPSTFFTVSIISGKRKVKKHYIKS